jgi:glycosyltransferase involved in cell wall biosynthesis
MKSSTSSKPEILVSVVVPIHNIEDKLDNLLKWLPCAIELGFEVILVCNGCLDNSFKLLETFLNSTSSENTKLLEIKEVGPGQARNTGLKMSSGKYTVFWDADDLGDPSNLLEAIKESRTADVVIGRYSVTSAMINPPTAKPQQIPNADLNAFALNPGLWRCIFLTSSIKGIEFGESRMGEDQVFLSRFLATNPEINFSHQNIYTYTIENPGQLTSVKKNMQGLVESSRNILDLINTVSTKYQKILIVFFIRQSITGIKKGEIRVKVIMFANLIRFLLTYKSKGTRKKEELKLFLGIFSGAINVD